MACSTQLVTLGLADGVLVHKGCIPLFIIRDARRACACIMLIIRTTIGVLMDKKIAFIGAGKMAEALIGGLIAKGIFAKEEIVACAPSVKTRDHVKETYGIDTYRSAAEIVGMADLVVLAVKPKHVSSVFSEPGISFSPEQTLISIVAGLTLNTLQEYVPDSKVVRVMPNHCCMVLEGAMGYTCGNGFNETDKKYIARILESTGLAIEVPEEYMDAITGIAGSSPAFMYLIIDAMADAGVLNGLSRSDSIKLAAQSMLGAAKMVLETGKHPDQLRDEVCSPAGTTIVGVKTLEDKGLRSAMIAAVDNTIAKSCMMSNKD